MKQRFAPAARAAMIRPSISWCGFFCINSRSLNAPGSDSSALQQRYLSMSPRGRNQAFFPIAQPPPPRPLRGGLSDRLVAAELSVGLDRSEPRLVDVAEQHAGLLARHQLFPF